MATYTVFHEESESEVDKCQILEPGEKKSGKLIPGSNFLSNIFLFISPGEFLTSNLNSTCPNSPLSQSLRSYRLILTRKAKHKESG